MAIIEKIHPIRKSGHLRTLAWISAILLSATVGFHWINPTRTPWMPPCPFHACTGYFCPGCGSLRALHHLFHGELLSALRMNPLMILAIPFLIWGAFEPKWTRSPRIVWFILVIVMAYTLLRNLPYEPFTLLAPFSEK